MNSNVCFLATNSSHDLDMQNMWLFVSTLFLLNTSNEKMVALKYLDGVKQFVIWACAYSRRPYAWAMLQGSFVNNLRKIRDSFERLKGT